MTMTSVAPHLAAQQHQQIDPVSAQQLIQGQLAQQQALLAQQQRQYPQQQQMAPYGFLGDLAGSVLPQVGSWVGQQLGSPQLGQQFGGIAGQLAQRFSPWEAGPAQQQMAPYGFLGDLAGSVLPQVGSWVGQQLGSPQLGQQFGGIAGQLAQRFSPWEAVPAVTSQQQYPQQQLPQAQYSQAQQYPQAQYPQQQYPQVQHQQHQQHLQGQHQNHQHPQAQQLQAQYLQQVAQQQLAQQHQQLQQLAQQQQLQQQQQLAPYGIFGGLAGSFLGGAGGRAIGDLFGGSQLGETIGRGAGGILGGLLPFGVPAAQYAGYPQPGTAYANSYLR